MLHTVCYLTGNNTYLLPYCPLLRLWSIHAPAGISFPSDVLHIAGGGRQPQPGANSLNDPPVPPCGLHLSGQRSAPLWKERNALSHVATDQRSVPLRGGRKRHWTFSNFTAQACKHQKKNALHQLDTGYMLTSD